MDHVERVQSDFLDVPGFEASHGNIYLHIKTEQTCNQTELVSGETFATFQSKYAADLLRIPSLYNNITALRLHLASNWYDQLWAIALAVNSSLPNT